MHVDLYDRYSFRMSLVHQLDPRIKVVITFLFILSNVLMPDGAWLAFAFSWGFILSISSLSGLGWGYVIKRSFIAIPFALAALSSVFALPGQPIFALEIGSRQFVGTDAGILRFASVMLRSWLSVQMAILLTATTPFPDLIHSLRHLRVPAPLVAVISFMYRYLFVLTNEVIRLLRARNARSAYLQDGGSTPLLWRARVAGNMAGQLFLRSYDRSERIYSAMLARGFQGQLLTINPHKMRRLDWLIGFLTLVLLISLQLLARYTY
ncbi:MAG: cobalt ECF transporter T component CbiQ [Anaerolineales bacterium]|nr:cobalt ECF transporter T component CbiQ [Anaerolineales bacterium]